MKKASETTKRVSSFVLIGTFVTLTLSLIAITLGINLVSTGDNITAGYLLLIGFLGLALSTYLLLQTRRRISRLKIQTPPVNTTLECGKCGLKNIREFQRGDFVFKTTEDLCQKCNEKMMIVAIYREVTDKKGKKPSG